MIKTTYFCDACGKELTCDDHRKTANFSLRSGIKPVSFNIEICSSCEEKVKKMMFDNFNIKIEF